MSNILRIARKELASFFSSLAAFIFMGVFLAVSLFIFFWVARFFARDIADVRPLFEWMPILLIFLVSAMTMRMWSEERRSGTIEFLLTSPVKPAQLVLGKFLACLALVAVALALTLPLPITVSFLGPLDWGPVVGGYVAALALASAYISIGLFVSSRTDNQVVSLILTSAVCGAFYLAGSDALTSLAGNAGGEILRLLGTGSRFDSIARGVIDVRDLYYYLSIFGVFLVLNLYSLESLGWSASGRDSKHLQWRLAAGLLIANLIAGNLWLGQLAWARADLTKGHVYSISNSSRVVSAPVAGAAADTRLFQRPDPSSAGAAGAAPARPAQGVSDRGRRQGAGRVHRSRPGADAGGRGQPSVQHPAGAVPDIEQISGVGHQFLLQHPRQVRG